LSVFDTPSKAQPAACKNLELGGGNGETFNFQKKVEFWAWWPSPL